MKDKILTINFKCKIKKKPEVSRESADESNCVHTCRLVLVCCSGSSANHDPSHFTLLQLCVDTT